MQKIIKVKCHAVTSNVENTNEMNRNVDDHRLNVYDKHRKLKNQLVKKVKERLSDTKSCAYSDWKYLPDSGIVVDPDGNRYFEGETQYEMYREWLWHQMNDKYLRGTGYQGWYHHNEEDIVIDPDGNRYTQADTQYWDMLKVYTIRKKHMGG